MVGLARIVWDISQVSCAVPFTLAPSVLFLRAQHRDAALAEVDVAAFVSAIVTSLQIWQPSASLASSCVGQSPLPGMHGDGQELVDEAGKQHEI